MQPFENELLKIATWQAHLVSLNGESQEGEDTDADCEGGGEGVDAAVNWAKYPLSAKQSIIRSRMTSL